MSRELFEGAYRKYWDRIECWPNPLRLYSYEVCTSIESEKWHIPFIGHLMAGELMESINLLNQWAIDLADLRTWSDVLSDYHEDDFFDLFSHFVDPLLFRSLFQPSSTRDRLGKVATNVIHQAHLIIESGYKDVLDQDNEKRFLLRRGVEKQLERLAKRWSNGNHLLAVLKALDSSEYRKKTSDFRNRASHFLAPRVEQGAVFFVSRERHPWTKLIQQADGNYAEKEVPGKTGVAYGYSYLEPLSLSQIIEANFRQFELAWTAFDTYSNLILEIMEVMCEKGTDSGWQDS